MFKDMLECNKGLMVFVLRVDPEILQVDHTTTPISNDSFVSPWLELARGARELKQVKSMLCRWVSQDL